MKISNIAYLIVAGIISLSSCKKDEVGPQGPAGPQGPPGAPGVSDTTGLGNSSIEAHIIQLTSSNWTGSSSNQIWSASITDSSITKEIVDSGMVSIFYFIPSTSSWTPLAYTQLIDVSTYVFRITDYTYAVNKINFKISQNAGGFAPTNPGNTKFKIVVASPSGRRANPFLDWDNYEEVKEALNLKE